MTDKTWSDKELLVIYSQAFSAPLEDHVRSDVVAITLEEMRGVLTAQTLGEAVAFLENWGDGQDDPLLVDQANSIREAAGVPTFPVPEDAEEDDYSFLDLRGGEVEIKVGPQGQVWVNVGGLCRFRLHRAARIDIVDLNKPSSQQETSYVFPHPGDDSSE